MKKLNVLLAGAAIALSGCSLGPHMRMSVPEGDAEGSAEYNGIKVVVHSIENGDFGAGASAQADSSKSDYSGLADLIVDSLPNLEYRIGPLDMVQVVVPRWASTSPQASA